jgi:hypothetical protein
MIELRRATKADVDFIVKAIMGAEKSGTDKLSYATVFGLNESQVEEILKDTIMEDIPGNELCISGFMLAIIEGVPSGAVCSWIEGADDIPSAILKANILYHFLGTEILERASQYSQLLDQLNIPRESGAIQIESVFVDNKFRGLGVSNKIILEQIKESIQNGPEVKKVQIQLAGNNESALRSYLKLGFKTKVTKQCDDKKILDLLPSDAKIMMELSIEELIKKGLLNLS